VFGNAKHTDLSLAFVIQSSDLVRVESGFEVRVDDKHPVGTRQPHRVVAVDRSSWMRGGIRAVHHHLRTLQNWLRWTGSIRGKHEEDQANKCGESTHRANVPSNVSESTDV
jgi:hypothetical protein